MSKPTKKFGRQTKLLFVIFKHSLVKIDTFLYVTLEFYGQIKISSSKLNNNSSLQYNYNIKNASGNALINVNKSLFIFIY